MGLKECKIIYNALSVSKKEKAIIFLKKLITEEDKKRIRTAIFHDPKSWFAFYHHGWGTNIRNALRREKLGEEYFGINNLDDIYVELIEDVVIKE